MVQHVDSVEGSLKPQTLMVMTMLMMMMMIQFNSSSSSFQGLTSQRQI